MQSSKLQFKIQHLIKRIYPRLTFHFELLTFNSRSRRAGFTLVEMLMYMGMFTILIGAFTQVFVTILDVQLESEATSAVDQDSRFIQSRITYDILRATTIDTPLAIGSSGPMLQLTIGGVSYSYEVTGNNIQITNNSGTDVLNSVGSTVSNLSFTRIGNATGKNTIRMNARVTSTTAVNTVPEVRDIQTTVGIR